eukprot:scaffold7114_cov67-Phaeocystis_antarctica.AAC.1
MRAVLAKRGRQSVIFGRVDTGTAAAGVATAGAAACGATAGGAAAGSDVAAIEGGEGSDGSEGSDSEGGEGGEDPCRATGGKKRRGKRQRGQREFRARTKRRAEAAEATALGMSGGDMRRAKAAERRVTEVAERRAADRNPTRAATSFGDQLADLVDESRRKSVMQAGEDLPPAAEEVRAGGVKAREERTRLKEARRRREAGLPPLTEEEAVAEAMQAGEGLLGWQHAAERRARSLS